MKSDLTSTLCTRCGLCCDGSIFDDVELSGEAEATTMEIMGLAIDTDDKPLLLQPCTALRGKRCSIYEHRPGCCRTFECGLLQRAMRGTLEEDEALGIIEQTLEHVAQIKELCRRAGEKDDALSLKERCIEVLSQPSEGDDDQTDHLRGELARAMDAMGVLIQQHFLG